MFDIDVEDNFVAYPGVWHTWTDAGVEVTIPVNVIGEFYEPGDNTPGYNVEITESVHGYTAGQRVGGIEHVYPA